jgi:glycosyltransferase involved in cell wall biosynthesis
MKFVLILMVKNEARIIERCMKSVEGLVDAYCIHDTGSTDTTKEIVTEFLKTHRGCLTESIFRDFGYSRTLSFQSAQDYVRDRLQWDLKTVYGLLLDGDMVFMPGTLKEQPLGEIGYSIIQVAGNLEYPNCRLVRMDHEWKCRGVTHEYWDAPTQRLGREICWIDDRNDGGCKSDKFERDARLLEEGLRNEPKNERYMFYLAQTYHSLGRWRDSIDMYKKRIDAGGWDEEIWYSHYMIGQCYLSLNNPIKFEQWMLKAHQLRPSRAEPLYKLAKYFREKGQSYKSMHYIQLGQSIPLSQDSLFVERPVYDGLFQYDATINAFYLQQPSGLELSTRFLLTSKVGYQDSVYRNLPFYIEPLPGDVSAHPVLHDTLGFDYHPTSVAFFTHKGKTHHNVRFVNYVINQKDGSYMMKDGNYSGDYKVRTQNLCWTPKSCVPMRDESVTLPRRDTRILGLEDVRVYTNATGDLCFVATSSEYSESIRMVQGKYHLNGTYSDCRVLQSPTNASCEKNWIPINNTNDIIYRWSPFEVGTIEGDTFKAHTTHTMPWFFHHIRGSAVPIVVDGQFWCLVHFVEYSAPRKYYHCFVKLDRAYKPIAISLPFVFRSKTIEYALGCSYENGKIIIGFSTMDDNPCLLTTSPDTLRWLPLSV